MRIISIGAAAAFLLASTFGAFAAQAGYSGDTTKPAATAAAKKSMHHNTMRHRTAMHHRARCRTSARQEGMLYCTALRHGKRVGYYRPAAHPTKVRHGKAVTHHRTRTAHKGKVTPKSTGGSAY